MYNIYWLCYYTVHVFVIIHFCDSMWSFREEAVYVLPLEIQLSIGGGWNPITGKPRHIFVSIPSQDLDY
jgi:hypothetical protein